MHMHAKKILLYTVLSLVGIYFFFAGMIKAQGFLVPFSFGVLFSMILQPVDIKFRSWGLMKGISIFLADLLLLAFCLGIFMIIATQIRNISEDWPHS